MSKQRFTTIHDRYHISYFKEHNSFVTLRHTTMTRVEAFNRAEKLSRELRAEGKHRRIMIFDSMAKAGAIDRWLCDGKNIAPTGKKVT